VPERHGPWQSAYGLFAQVIVPPSVRAAVSRLAVSEPLWW
jgi:hypothetical protein